MTSYILYTTNIHFFKDFILWQSYIPTYLPTIYVCMAWALLECSDGMPVFVKNICTERAWKVKKRNSMKRNERSARLWRVCCCSALNHGVNDCHMWMLHPYYMRKKDVFFSQDQYHVIVYSNVTKMSCCYRGKTNSDGTSSRRSRAEAPGRAWGW